MSLGAVNRGVVDVIPLKSIILNILSVGTVYRLMLGVLQKDCRVPVLSFQQTPIIVAWIPLFLFTVLFALYMNCHVSVAKGT
jgi:RND superfamily putative drug exporter